jgi:hypothetical protein
VNSSTWVYNCSKCVPELIYVSAAAANVLTLKQLKIKKIKEIT